MVCFFFLLVNSGSAQDSIHFEQEKEIGYVDYYVFYSNGNFKHCYSPKVGSSIQGKGYYIDNKKKRILFFERLDSGLTTNPNTKYEGGFRRVLKMKGQNRFKCKDFYAVTRRRMVFYRHYLLCDLIIKSSNRRCLLVQQSTCMNQ